MIVVMSWRQAWHTAIIIIPMASNTDSKGVIGLSMLFHGGFHVTDIQRLSQRYVNKIHPMLSSPSRCSA